MAKTAKKTTSKAGKSKAPKAAPEKESFEQFVTSQMSTSTGTGRKKKRTLVTSAPHYKFETKGQCIECKVLGKIIPTDGEFAGKLIGWNVVDINTSEVVMLGSTHQIQKAFETDEKGQEIWTTGALFSITWLGKSDLGNGRTFNNFDIGVIEE